MTDSRPGAPDPYSAYGVLSVRALFDISAQCQRECGFLGDAWAATKREESEGAMRALPALLTRYSELPRADRLAAIATGLLAGNIFDWGAPEVSKAHHVPRG
jgi:type II pantothenate kinase